MPRSPLTIGLPTTHLHAGSIVLNLKRNTHKSYRNELLCVRQWVMIIYNIDKMANERHSGSSNRQIWWIQQFIAVKATGTYYNPDV